MIIAAELISAIWGKMKMYRLIVLITLIIIRIVFYIIDARREKQGLPSKHREYMGSLTGGMDFIEQYRRKPRNAASTDITMTARE